jgi:Family of unknown function (DUF5343)
MALTNAYLVTTKNLEGFFNAILSAKAPERFNSKFLTELGFSSSNDRLFISLLKGLGFVDDAGAPQQRYYDFLDQSQSKQVLAQAVAEAYEDLFRVNTKANEMSVDEVKNKLKTLTRGEKSETVTNLMANTFKALCDYSDWTKPKSAPVVPAIVPPEPKKENQTGKQEIVDGLPGKSKSPQLHYNIQIHLPESRDSAVYDAIFRSLKEHLLQ